MNTRAIGARTKQRGFSARAVPRNTPAASATATHAWVSVRRPVGSSRALVRGLRASSARSAMRLKPSATNRAQVKARMTRPSVRPVRAVSRDATTSQSNAKGSAKTVWGSLTKLTYRTSKLSPAKVWPSELNPQLLPHGVDSPLRLRIHDDLVRPFAGESFLLPLACGVDAHLRSEGEATARVVEHVDRAHAEPHITLGIDVVQRDPPRLFGVAHVDVLVEDDDDLRQRHEPLPPQPVHHLVRLARI